MPPEPTKSPCRWLYSELRSRNAFLWLELNGFWLLLLHVVALEPVLVRPTSRNSAPGSILSGFIPLHLSIQHDMRRSRHVGAVKRQVVAWRTRLIHVTSCYI